MSEQRAKIRLRRERRTSFAVFSFLYNQVIKIMDELKKKIDDLSGAKDAVRFLLDHPDGRVNMQSISFWAGEVERLRNEIKCAL